MPRVVNCSESNCFLKTPDGIGAKFCQECGASATTKVTITKAECPSCHTELDDHARFCSECGTRVQSTNEARRAQTLIDNHKKREIATGRGLTAAEARRIEEASRKPSRVSDPERKYLWDEDHKSIMNISVPEADNKANQMAKGRTAIQNPTGKHIAGGLSSTAKLPADYHEGVRVIPYRFSTPAKRGSQLVTGGATPDHSTSDDAFFQDDPELDPFFQDDGDQSAADRDVQANKARRKQAANASEAAAKVKMSNKPPPKRKNCHECGRIMNAEGECGHCVIDDDAEMSVEEMSKLW